MGPESIGDATGRILADVPVASLALVFDRILQRKLEQAGLQLLNSPAAQGGRERERRGGRPGKRRVQRTAHAWCKAGSPAAASDCGSNSLLRDSPHASPIGVKPGYWGPLGNNADLRPLRFNDL